MVRPTKPIKDQIIKDWLQEFSVKHTKQSYLSSMRNFKRNLGIESLDQYVKNNPDATADLKKFLISLKGRPSTTIASNVSALKTFFNDHDISFDLSEMRKFKRRGFMPKRVRAETRDKKLTKAQLKKILNYLDIKGRALVLFLLSSGCRVGEATKLKVIDFDLDVDPPRADIRGEYTKNGVGARTVFFSYEARDAIKDWLKIKHTLIKRNGMQFNPKMVFDWTVGTSTYMWNRAIEKASLDTKDEKTKRRIYHLHGLRKFFRSEIGLDTDITHALMGHSAYLDDAYVRLNQTEIAEAYQKNIERVSVYAVEDIELRKEMKTKSSEIEQLRTKLEQLENNKPILEALLSRILELERRLSL